MHNALTFTSKGKSVQKFTLGINSFPEAPLEYLLKRIPATRYTTSKDMKLQRKNDNSSTYWSDRKPIREMAHYSHYDKNASHTQARFYTSIFSVKFHELKRKRVTSYI